MGYENWEMTCIGWSGQRGGVRLRPDEAEFPFPTFLQPEFVPNGNRDRA